MDYSFSFPGSEDRWRSLCRSLADWLPVETKCGVVTVKFSSGAVAMFTRSMSGHISCQCDHETVFVILFKFILD